MISLGRWRNLWYVILRMQSSFGYNAVPDGTAAAWKRRYETFCVVR